MSFANLKIAQDTKKQLEKTYKKGTRIMLIRMDDKWAPPAGTFGTVTGIDDAGQIHVLWDNGSSLALIWGVDDFKIIISVTLFDKTKEWTSVSDALSFYEKMKEKENVSRAKISKVIKRLKNGEKLIEE